MPFLSAQTLTEDPKGLSRLKAVIATDPGYEMRAQHAAEALPTPGSANAGPSVTASCEPLSVSSPEAPAGDRIASLVAGGVAAAGTVVAGFVSLVNPVRDGSTAIL